MTRLVTMLVTRLVARVLPVEDAAPSLDLREEKESGKDGGGEVEHD